MKTKWIWALIIVTALFILYPKAFDREGPTLSGYSLRDNTKSCLGLTYYYPPKGKIADSPSTFYCIGIPVSKK